jgi:uncharacterized protein (DUF952 family)
MALLYKIVPAALWQEAQRAGVFRGSAVDTRDGFIHFSTATQVAETAAKHFAGKHDLLLLSVDGARLGDALKWEPSRGGALFPHLYGVLDVAAVAKVEPLPLGPDGRHLFPPLVPDRARVFRNRRRAKALSASTASSGLSMSLQDLDWDAIRAPARRRSGSTPHRVIATPRPRAALRYRCPRTGAFVLVTDEATLGKLCRPRAQLRCADCGEPHLLTVAAEGVGLRSGRPAPLTRR